MSDTNETRHPLAGTKMVGADIIMQVLIQEGVDTIFGYSGGAILPTYDAIFRHNEQDTDHPVRLVVPANEQGAGFMAAGYARASGKVGVCLVTSGPGATNTVTPVRDSYADSTPMVLICGQVARAAIGTDAFQEAPVYNIMSSCAKHCFLVTDPEKLEATVRTAFEVARTGRPGPVVIDVPKDVQNWVGEFRGEGKLEFRGYKERAAQLEANSTVPAAECTRFFDLLAQSECPLLYVGGGAINADASAEITAFAERHGIPVVTTLMGLGAIDTTHELAMGMLGMHGHAYANYIVEDCDFLIAVGARFDDRVAGNVKAFAPRARHIAHIDIDASEVGKVKAVDWHHVGHVKPALQSLLAFDAPVRNRQGWLEHARAVRRRHAMNFDRNSTMIQPYEIIEELNKITKGEAIVATGVGQHQMWAAQYFDFKNPRSWLTSGSMGTMGFGLPAAIGAQIANPDKIVIDVDGDASIRMNLGELETVTTENLPVKVLLMNNLGDGMVKQWQKLFFNDRFSASDKSLHKKDFIKAAEADGYEFARRLTDRAQVRQVLEEFVAFPGPAFLEVMIDPDAGVFPMVGPGQSYKQMVTGEWIEARAQDEHGRMVEDINNEMF